MLESKKSSRLGTGSEYHSGELLTWLLFSAETAKSHTESHKPEESCSKAASIRKGTRKVNLT